MNIEQFNLYHRHDAVVGVGFEIEHAGRKVHSIAWPDRPSERMSEDYLKRVNCKYEPAGSLAVGDEKQQAEHLPTAVAHELVVGERDELRAKVAELEKKLAAAQSESPSDPKDSSKITEAESIRQYLAEHPSAGNKEVVEALAAKGIEINSSQVSTQRKKLNEQKE